MRGLTLCGIVPVTLLLGACAGPRLSEYAGQQNVARGSAVDQVRVDSQTQIRLFFKMYDEDRLCLTDKDGKIFRDENGQAYFAETKEPVVIGADGIVRDRYGNPYLKSDGLRLVAVDFHRLSNVEAFNQVATGIGSLVVAASSIPVGLHFAGVTEVRQQVDWDGNLNHNGTVGVYQVPEGQTPRP